MARVVVVYAVLRLAWGLLVPKRATRDNRDRVSPGKQQERFDTSSRDVSDAEFEDVK